MTTFYLSYVFLIVLWFFGRELINFIEHHYTTGMASDLVSLGIKAVIMVGLGLFWISRTNAQLWIDKRKLYNGNFPTVFWVVLAMFIAYLFFLMFSAHHGFYLQPNPFKSGEFLSVTLGAGFIEEFLFRGFFMNFFDEAIRDFYRQYYPSNLISDQSFSSLLSRRTDSGRLAH